MCPSWSLHRSAGGSRGATGRSTSWPTWRCRSTTAGTGRRSSAWVKHIILPVLGLFAIGVPVYYLSKPGQPQPHNWFPYAALVIVVAAVAYSIVASRRDPELGERAGSIIADE
jgi:hypothetical protein